MGMYEYECEKCKKIFTVGVPRGVDILYHAMGIPNVRIFEVYQKDQELMKSKVPCFDYSLSKCPQCGSDKKYFKELSWYV